MGLLHEVPKVKMPKRVPSAKVMKGRPITLEEFEQMLAKIEQALSEPTESERQIRKKNKPAKRKMTEDAEKVLRERLAKAAAAVAPSWEYLLRGLWLSGLRIGEALNLFWDDETKLLADLTGRRPMFRIRAEFENGHKDRLLPMTPDFAAFLLQTPEHERTGSVFDPSGIYGRICRDPNCTSKIISRIGRAAVVKVNMSEKGKVKYASAHDLRRAFGARWAARVMPAQLKELMRHEDISTTMKYYVGHNAEATADAIWESL